MDRCGQHGTQHWRLTVTCPVGKAKRGPLSTRIEKVMMWKTQSPNSVASHSQCLFSFLLHVQRRWVERPLFSGPLMPAADASAHHTITDATVNAKCKALQRGNTV